MVKDTELLTDQEVLDALKDFEEYLLKNSKPLDVEVQKILEENFWDLV